MLLNLADFLVNLSADLVVRCQDVPEFRLDRASLCLRKFDSDALVPSSYGVPRPGPVAGLK